MLYPLRRSHTSATRVRGNKNDTRYRASRGCNRLFSELFSHTYTHTNTSAPARTHRTHKYYRFLSFCAASACMTSASVAHCCLLDYMCTEYALFRVPRSQTRRAQHTRSPCFPCMYNIMFAFFRTQRLHERMQYAHGAHIRRTGALYVATHMWHTYGALSGGWFILDGTCERVCVVAFLKC